MQGKHWNHPHGCSRSLGLSFIAHRKARLSVAILFWAFILGVRAQGQTLKEYIYLDERLIAVETEDVTPAGLKITSPTSAGTLDTEDDSVTLAGLASDNTAVDRVTWNNDRGGRGACRGTTSWKCGGIGLQSGRNALTVTARDIAGNMRTARLTVIRR